LSQNITIAVDAMGGDHGPSVTVPASLQLLRETAELQIILVGSESVIRPLMAGREREFGARLRVQNATQIVEMGERPQDALRKKKDSSMRVAIDLVKSAEAQACVSAGNTGALMATARFVLKTLPGVDRPAILSRIPAHHSSTYMLDLGANADCTPEQLLQFAVMGSVVAADIDGVSRPRVGLLNIGEEDMKGNERVQQAAKYLSASPLNYIGFVEGNDIFSDEVDVVVTDGFTGNVALKTIEGVAKMIGGMLREELTRSSIRKLGAVASQPALTAFKRRLDPRGYNGASMVGLAGVVIKSHGNADEYSFGNAIRVALIEARKGVATEISKLLSQVQVA
jgi:glycerol-3-phosphate acyltransferase PlsX